MINFDNFYLGFEAGLALKVCCSEVGEITIYAGIAYGSTGAIAKCGPALILLSWLPESLLEF